LNNVTPHNGDLEKRAFEGGAETEM